MMPGTLVPIFRHHVPTRWHEWGSANFPAIRRRSPREKSGALARRACRTSWLGGKDRNL